MAGSPEAAVAVMAHWLVVGIPNPVQPLSQEAPLPQKFSVPAVKQRTPRSSSMPHELQLEVLDKNCQHSQAGARSCTCVPLARLHHQSSSQAVAPRLRTADASQAIAKCIGVRVPGRPVAGTMTPA